MVVLVFIVRYVFFILNQTWQENESEGDSSQNRLALEVEQKSHKNITRLKLTFYDY